MIKKFIIIQARTSSQRLPNKVIKKLGSCETILEFIFKRLSLFNKDLYLVTSNQREDDILESIALNSGVNCYRGSLDDVLGRFNDGANYFGASSDDIIVRVTGDNPFVDPNLLNEMLNFYSIDGCDYLSNVICRTFPKGLDLEFFKYKHLRETNSIANSSYNREHVSAYMYSNESGYALSNFSNDSDYSNYSVTVDTLYDYNYITNLLKHIGNESFNYHELFKALDTFTYS